MLTFFIQPSVMATTEKEMTTPIYQFKYQLNQLLDTFHWIPQNQQLSAFLTAQEFVNKLERICRCRQGTNIKNKDRDDEVSNSLLISESEKSTEKILTSLIPLNAYDGVNNHNLAPSDLTDHQSTDSGCYSGVYVDGGHQKHDDASSEEIVSLSSSSSTSFDVTAQKEIQEMCQISSNHTSSSCKIDSTPTGDDNLDPLQLNDCNQTSDNMLTCTQLVNYDDYRKIVVEHLPVGQSETCHHHHHQQLPSEETLPSPQAVAAKGNYLKAFNKLQLEIAQDIEEGLVSDSVTILQHKSKLPCPKRKQNVKLSSTVGVRGRKRKFSSNDIEDLQHHRTTSVPSDVQNDDLQCMTDNITGIVKVSQLKKRTYRRIAECPDDRINVPRTTESLTTHLSSSASELLALEDTGAVSCRMCRLEFTSFQLFEQHLCKNGKTFMICETCDRRFGRPRQFHKHIVSHKFKAALKVHTINKGENGTRKSKKYYPCPHCEKKFLQRSSLYAHLREHAEGKIVCTKCGIMCDDEDKYEQHVTKHAEEASSYCEKCDESFVRRQQYDQHVAGHEKYDCIPCQKNFSTKKQMLKHQRIIHGIRTPEERRHECQICHKKFQRPTLLESHTRVHTGEKPIQCGHCDKSFRTSKSLTKHLKTSTHMKACGEFEEKALEATKPFLCAQCGAKFFRKQGLLRHMQQLHSEERPYECEFCEYKCKCKTNLKRHIELHKDERRFICELCGASFHAHATLKEHHAYVHSDVRGFVCPNCGKGFKGRSGLRRHIRSHSDARPFICFCGQSYKRMSHLKRHMASIHAVSFKSKRVQRIVPSEGQLCLNGGYLGEDSNSFLMAMNPSSEVEGTIPFLDVTTTKEVPILNAGELLIIDGSKTTDTSSLVAQTLTLEVATQTVGQNVLTNNMHIPNQPPSSNTTMIAASQPLPIEIPSSSLTSDTTTTTVTVVDQSLNSTVTPLPSISDTVELRRALAFASIVNPLSTGNIAVSIPAEVTPQQPSFSSVPSKDQSVAYQVVPTLTSSIPLQALDSEPKMMTAGPESTLIPMATEFYTQGLAQYITM